MAGERRHEAQHASFPEQVAGPPVAVECKVHVLVRLRCAVERIEAPRDRVMDLRERLCIADRLGRGEDLQRLGQGVG
jgi:hypothetical protein